MYIVVCELHVHTCARRCTRIRQFICPGHFSSLFAFILCGELIITTNDEGRSFVEPYESVTMSDGYTMYGVVRRSCWESVVSPPYKVDGGPGQTFAGLDSVCIAAGVE